MDTVRNTSNRANRIWSLDLLRILASFGIIVLHTSPLPPEHGGVDGLPWKIVITISILFRWCVPAFFMISGALFLSPERKLSTVRLYKKTILRIASCFIFWSAVYAVAHCVIMDKGKWTFINQLLRGHYHMWYIFSILALYMLTPLLRKMTENRKLTEYYLVLGFVFTFLLPRLLAFIQLFSPPHADVIASMQSAVAQLNPLPGAYALYYFVLGHDLHAYPVGIAPRRLLIGAGVIGYIATTALTLWHSSMIGAASGQFYDMSSLTVLMMAVAVFLFFNAHFASFQPGPRAERILTELSACSFGVYLVHPFLIERLSLTLPPSPVVLLVGTPALVFLIYLLALAISFTLRRIPLLGKYIT